MPCPGSGSSSPTVRPRHTRIVVCSAGSPRVQIGVDTVVHLSRPPAERGMVLHPIPLHAVSVRAPIPWRLSTKHPLIRPVAHPVVQEPSHLRGSVRHPPPLVKPLPGLRRPLPGPCFLSLLVCLPLDLPEHEPRHDDQRYWAPHVVQELHQRVTRLFLRGPDVVNEGAAARSDGHQARAAVRGHQNGVLALVLQGDVHLQLRHPATSARA
mmetsp:Transcript_45389/g.110518  ORF Transcript_45389/g.110518 Transcript_45389/m.110518 type:complete len:210 (-) Transcript_45389:560-1189(-)